MLLFGFNGRATRNFLGVLCLMHVVLFLDRLNLAAAATTIQKDLGLSNIALGLAFSAFNYSYAPFQMVGGWFADRFWRAAHLDGLRTGVVDHDHRDRRGERAGIAV
jgi:MFS family permease